MKCEKALTQVRAFSQNVLREVDASREETKASSALPPLRHNF